MSAEAPQSVVEKPFVNPRFLEYWPRSNEQARRALIVQERFRIWGTLLEEVITSFTAIQEAESRIGKEYARLATVFTPTVDEIAGTEQNINAVAETLGKFSAQFQLVVKTEDETLKKLKSLRDRITNDGKKFKKAYEKLYASAEKGRLETIDAIGKYESTQAKRTQARFLSTTDPFLSGQVVSNVISAMIETENEYRKGTADLFVQAAETDRKLVEDLHKIWKEHGTSLQNFHQTMIQITLKFTSFVDQMKTSSPFSEFSRRHDVVASEVFATAITVENFGFEVEHTAIVKEGLLFKQGGFFRNSWKPAWGVLTQSGYFHLFQHSETKGFFSSKPTDSKDIFYRRMTKPETLITVQLRKPRVFVDLPGMTQSASNVSTSKSGPVFEIVEISSSKSLLGGSSSSIPDVGDDKAGTAPLSAVSSGTETRYLLKTNKEEEMVDWVVALRRALEESPTETAPIPLLRHPTELKKEVDEQLRRPSPKEDRPGKRPASRGSEESLDKAIDSPQTPTDPRGRGGEASESPSRSERSRSPKKKVALPSFGNPWV